MVSTPGPAHQFESLCVDVSDCGILAQEESQATFPQLLDESQYGDSDFRQDDTCVSLDPETMNNILYSLNECLGQNFLQLLNSQDPNSNVADTNLNHMEAGLLPVSSYVDSFYNQEHPQELQDIFLRQVKTEDDSWRLQ